MSFALYKYEHEKYGPCMMLLYDPDQGADQKVKTTNNDQKTIPVNKKQDNIVTKIVHQKANKSPPPKDIKDTKMRKSPPLQKQGSKPHRQLKKVSKDSKQKSTIKPSLSLPKGNISKQKSLRIKSTQKNASFSKKKKQK